MQEKDNPKYFTQRGFLYSIIVKEIKAILEQNKNEFIIEFNDISEMFIFGNNIEGEYSPNESLKIYVYFENLVSNEGVLKKELNKLQEILRRNQKYNIDFKLTLILSERNPKEFLFRYYDLLNDEFVINRQFKQTLTKKSVEQKVYFEVDKPKEILKENISSEKIMEQKEESKEKKRFPTIIAVPKTFEEFTEILRNEGNNIIDYTKQNIKEINEKTLDVLGLGTSEKKKIEK